MQSSPSSVWSAARRVDVDDLGADLLSLLLGGKLRSLTGPPRLLRSLDRSRPLQGRGMRARASSSAASLRPDPRSSSKVNARASPLAGRPGKETPSFSLAQASKPSLRRLKSSIMIGSSTWASRAPSSPRAPPPTARTRDSRRRNPTGSSPSSPPPSPPPPPRPPCPTPQPRAPRASA